MYNSYMKGGSKKECNCDVIKSRTYAKMISCLALLLCLPLVLCFDAILLLIFVRAYVCISSCWTYLYYRE